MPGGDVLRVLDANLNRAREAMRVLEDAARFVLGDAALSSSCKQMRDDLRGVVAAMGLDALQLAAARDTPGDVGTGLSSPGEWNRAGASGVVIAAGKRLSEALRTIEEYSKLLPSEQGGAGAAGIKQLRYQAYEVERRLTLALATGRARQWTLCVLITEALCSTHTWDRVAELAVHGGADCLQLREKCLDGGELVRRATRLMEIARGRASVIVNDRVDVALAAGADGVHVGQTDMSVRDVRRIAGGRLVVGVSSSCIEEAHAARDAGADYCGVGPMFATTTKDKPRIAGAEYLRAYLADERAGKLPHLAIGGITSANVGELARAGCRGVAVSSAVCGAADPRRVCEEIVRVLNNEPRA